MTRHKTVALALLAGVLLAACADSRDVVAPLAKPAAGQAAVQVGHAQPAPALVSTVAFGSRTLALWPYTGDNFSGTPVDPINLLFPGRTPMQVRALLLKLDGDRSGMPGLPPGLPPQFQALLGCTWRDAAGGGNQTAYSDEGGWVGSVVQLTCGEFGLRFHLRLFSAGAWTMGGAHFDLQIPGLPEHETVSWLLPRNLVAYDVARSGRLDPAAPIAYVTTGSAAPTYRSIRSLVWDNLPPVFQAILGGSPELANDGQAVVLNLASTPPIEAMTADQDFTLPMGSPFPKPFCAAGPTDWVYVTGSMHVTGHVVVTPSGNYWNTQKMTVNLNVMQFDLSTGQPTGAPFQGIITDDNYGRATGNSELVTDSQLQSMFPAAPFRGTLTSSLKVGPGNSSTFSADTVCTH